jgi:hypothetical protein
VTRARDTADTQDNIGGAVAPFVAGKNAIINGGMDIWQRGTSVAISSGGVATYASDRWLNTRTVAGQTISRQATGDTTNLPFIQYCARVQRDSGNTNTTQPIRINQLLETVNSIPFAGKTVTLSFYARAGANFSAASSILTAQLISGTGTDQNVLSGGYTGIVYPISSQVTLTTTWQRFSITGIVAATATELSVNIYYETVGTAGAADFFEITGVQLEIGSAATPFARAGGSIGGELALCQRYYWRTSYNSTYTHLGTGIANSTTALKLIVPLPVQLRTVPSSFDWAGSSGLMATDGVNNLFITAIAGDAGYISRNIIYLNCTFSGATQFRSYQVALGGAGDTTQYLGCSAEL